MRSTPDRHDVRQVTVLLAASRSGSSFLFRALSSSGALLAPTGEETPFFRMAGIGNFDGVDYSDEILKAPSEEALDAAGSLLLQDVGLRESRLSDRESFAKAILRRFAIQWPDIPARDREALEAGLLTRLQSLSPGFSRWRDFYLEWIEELRKRGLPVSAEPYDAASAPRPPTRLLEEPPLIIPEPMLPITRELAAMRPLLLKTSTHVYRIPLLRALFPLARFRWILLTRNPAASISALMDGWLSGGFHSHRVSPHLELGIPGYSEAVPGGREYWKFDLPPGWRDFTRSPLAEVCAHQWLSANQAMLRFAGETSDPIFRIRYEDLLDPARIQGQLRSLLEFAGAPSLLPEQEKLSEAVAAVSAPRRGKWKRRSETILPLVRHGFQGAIRETALKLGYSPEEIGDWP